MLRSAGEPMPRVYTSGFVYDRMKLRLSRAGFGLPGNSYLTIEQHVLLRASQIPQFVQGPVNTLAMNQTLWDEFWQLSAIGASDA